MIISQDYLRTQSIKRNITISSEQRIINENAAASTYSATKEFDIFLSHSFLDKELVLTLIELFNECNYSVYVDWLYDNQLERNNVTTSIAKLLKIRMRSSKGLAYLTTSNSTNSKWCPWELGYFDGYKKERCCILPILYANTFKGQEYLGLYPYLEYSQIQGSNDFDFWVYDNVNIGQYVILSDWLKGSNPSSH